MRAQTALYFSFTKFSSQNFLSDAYGSRIVEKLLIDSKRIPKSSLSSGWKLFESSDIRILEELGY